MAAAALPEVDRFPLPSAGAVLLWLQLPLLLIVLYWSYEWLIEWIDQPLANVDVSGDLQQTDAKALRLSVWQLAKGTYMDLDLGAIKSAVETQPWVYRVDVRRQWPAGLALEVAEQKPVARWGEGSLLNSEATVFTPATTEDFESLPLMNGPESRALQMMQQYRAMSELLRPLGLKITALQLEPRGAWTLTFENGIRLLLGRGATIEKLQRFSRVYGAQLMPYREKIQSVDARYTNGLSVSWKEGENGTDSDKAGRNG